MMEKLLTIQELAEVLGVSPRWVMDKAAARDLPSFKIGNLRRFRQSDVEEWLERQKAA